MNISGLSDDNFNSVAWINAEFQKLVKDKNLLTEDASDTNEGENAMEFINSYLSKLQLCAQEVNYAVEESSQKLVSCMPRIIKDTKTLQNDVQQLQKKMLRIHEDVAAVQEETGDCMANLKRLNSMQIKLQNAKESLQESDGWGNLVTQLEEHFERNDLSGVCEKIMTLQKSLQAQEQLVGHNERQSQVEDFKNRLEALASPSIVQCFAENNNEQVQHFVQIFLAIQRKPQLLQYYRAVHKNTLQQQWRQTLDLQSNESSMQQQHFLSLFYDTLLETCKRQVKWCKQIFQNDEEDQQQPFILLAELLPALQPTRDNHILQLLKTCNERLELLQQYAHDNHQFALQLNAFLKQSSIQLPQDVIKKLSNAIYEYFHKFIMQYPQLEETHLSTMVDRLLVTQSHASEAVRHLKESISKLFDWLQAGLIRCSKITENLSLCKLINLLGGIFKRLLEQFSKTQRQLMLNSGLHSTTANTENSWTLLQYTLALLECLYDFQQKLQNFEGILFEQLCDLHQNLIQNSYEKLNIYCSFEGNERQRLLASVIDLKQKHLESNEDNPSIQSGIFSYIYDSLKPYYGETHDITLNILLQPLEVHLSNIQPPPETSQQQHLQNMPSFSFTPQESITQIGQYLLTLPQHLEPLLLVPSVQLKQALEICNVQYSQSTPSVDILLSLVVTQCCVLLQNRLLQIKTLSQFAANQIAVDIEYISNVMEELGFTLTTTLKQILTLLKALPEEYHIVSGSCELRLVNAIRQMRNLNIT